MLIYIPFIIELTAIQYRNLNYLHIYFGNTGYPSTICLSSITTSYSNNFSKTHKTSKK